MADEAVIYRADHVLEYPFVRSVGPLVGAFLTGLRDGKVVGTRGTAAAPRPAHRVRPRDGGRDLGIRRGRARGHGHLVVLGAPAPAEAPAADAVRLGAGPIRRRRHRVPTRAAGVGARRGLDRHAGPPEFAPEEERVGHVKDIRHFVPAGGAR